jgi:hypothetical protein
MGGRTRCRGSRETPGSLFSARPWDRSGRPDRPARFVRRGTSPPPKTGQSTADPGAGGCWFRHSRCPAVRRCRGDANGPRRPHSAHVSFVFLAPGIEGEARNAARRLGLREPGAGRLRRAGATILMYKLMYR